MSYFPLIIVIIFAVLDWIAVHKKWRTTEYIFKPATMLAILWWIWQSVGWGGPMLWFTIGAVFCLAGDIFLMLPKDMFIFGLLAFLLGQISYVIGFNNIGPYINLLGVILIVLLGIYIGWLYPKLVGGLKTKGKENLRIPVLIYAVVISSMVYSALMTWTRPGWSHYAALSVSIGALLFYASDSMLAWGRFVSPLRASRIREMTTYHLGQIGIILGAILHAFIK